MLTNPRRGQLAQVHYAKRYAHTMPYHGRIGTIAVVCRGRPRNHGILIDGELIAVPCGNLRTVKGKAKP